MKNHMLVETLRLSGEVEERWHEKGKGGKEDNSRRAGKGNSIAIFRVYDGRKREGRGRIEEEGKSGGMCREYENIRIRGS